MSFSEYNFINLEEQQIDHLDGLLSAMEVSLGVSLTLHDPKGLFRSSGVSREWFRHKHPICNHQRVGAADQKCMQTCFFNVGDKALSDSRAFEKHCWKGISELVVPIYIEQSFQFILFAGPFHIAESEVNIVKEIEDEYQQLSVLGEEKRGHLSRLLNNLGEGICEFLSRQVAGRGRENERKTQIKKFMFQHGTEGITLNDLSAHLHLSSSRTSHLVSELFGKSFSDMIKEERIKRACSILENSGKPINQIPQLIGIENEYYFFRLFKKEVGMTPKKYRLQFLGEKEKPG